MAKRKHNILFYGMKLSLWAVSKIAAFFQFEMGLEFLILAAMLFMWEHLVFPHLVYEGRRDPEAFYIDLNSWGLQLWK